MVPARNFSLGEMPEDVRANSFGAAPLLSSETLAPAASAQSAATLNSFA